MSHYSTPVYSSLAPHAQPKPFLPFSSPGSATAPFNPKKISEAASRPAPIKKAPVAPYVQLDQHNEYSDAPKAMREQASPISRQGWNFARWCMILLRTLQLLGALGLLLGMLFLRKVEGVTGWICRVPPGIAIVHTVYSIYHFSSPRRLITPGSTIGYMMLASTVDLAIMAFYTFTAILCYRQYSMGDDMEWETIFKESDMPGIGHKIVFAVFIVACSAGGLALVTIGESFYLIRCFRILVALPPDMNPFVADDIPDKYEKPTKAKHSMDSARSSSEYALNQPRHVPYDTASPRSSTEVPSLPIHTTDRASSWLSTSTKRDYLPVSNSDDFLPTAPATPNSLQNLPYDKPRQSFSHEKIDIIENVEPLPEVKPLSLSKRDREQKEKLWAPPPKESPPPSPPRHNPTRAWTAADSASRKSFSLENSPSPSLKPISKRATWNPNSLASAPPLRTSSPTSSVKAMAMRFEAKEEEVAPKPLAGRHKKTKSFGALQAGKEKVVAKGSSAASLRPQGANEGRQRKSSAERDNYPEFGYVK